jgi:hypothetical protein
VPVSLEGVEPGAWTEKDVDPDIINGSGKLYKKARLSLALTGRASNLSTPMKT